MLNASSSGGVVHSSVALSVFSHAFIHIYILYKHAHIVSHLYVPVQRGIEPGCCAQLNTTIFGGQHVMCLIMLDGVDAQIVSDDFLLPLTSHSSIRPTTVKATRICDMASYSVYTVCTQDFPYIIRGCNRAKVASGITGEVWKITQNLLFQTFKGLWDNTFSSCLCVSFRCDDDNKDDCETQQRA